MNALPPLAAATPHAILVPLPAQGHINPLMHFAKQLASSFGFRITFVMTELALKQITRAQSPDAAHSDPHLQMCFEAIADGLPADHPRFNSIMDSTGKVNFDGLMALEQELIKEELDQLVERLIREMPPVVCIVADFSIPFAQDVANKHGLPYIAFWPQSAASYACHDPSKESVCGDIVTCLPGVPPLNISDIPSSVRSSDPSDFIYRFVTRPFERIREAACILLNTFDELEQRWVQALRKKYEICTIGPVLAPGYLEPEGDSPLRSTGTALWAEEHGCIPWLDKQKPSSVLYVSFGSFGVLSAHQVEELTSGLEACEQPLLLVSRPNPLYGNKGMFPSWFADRVRDRAMVVSWAPQLEVLSHPSVGGFLTHCGWNSTTEGISRGVPMLAWPLFSDQVLNRRFIVEEWKVGLAMEVGADGVVGREEVERKVRGLMVEEEGREIRTRAAKMKEAVKRAVSEGGSSHTNLKHFFTHKLKL